MIDPTAYQWLRIEPTDAWFFRDGRPSNRGEDQNDIESEFPPNATTVVGALRAALARAGGWNGRGSWCNQNEQLKQVLGDGFDDLGQLRFLGPFLCKQFDSFNGKPARQELLWSLPQHVVGRFKDGEFLPEALMWPSHERVCCDVDSAGITLAAVPAANLQESAHGERARQKPPSHPDNVYVTTTGLNAVLRGECPAAGECICASSLYAHEGRVGIRRDVDTRTTGSGDIYSPRYVRLQPGVSLVQAVAGVPDSWAWPSVMALGGESRMATIDRLPSKPDLPEVHKGPTTVTIALSPAKFTSSWWGAGPGDAASKMSDELSGEVTCVALDRPRFIGGWDFNSGPHPLSPFVAPGTVWWLRDSATGPALVQIGISTDYGYGLVALTAQDTDQTH